MKLNGHPAFFAAIAAAGLASASSAAILHYQAVLSGAVEAPPNASPGTGFAQVDIDSVLNTMRVQVTFSGLLGNVTACHIHSPTASAGSGTAGVSTTTPTFTGFPSGVTSGSYDHLFDLTLASSWNPAFITANGGTPTLAMTAFLNNLAAGKAYLNVHTSAFPSGEIRGFLEVPAPASLALVGLGCLMGARRRRA